jgi:hypothetical protein
MSEISKNKTYTIEFWLKVKEINSNEVAIMKKRNYSNAGLFIQYNNLIFKCGQDSTYIECSVPFFYSGEPMHVAMSYDGSKITLMVNKRLVSEYIESDIFPDIDTSHEINNFFDFYGNGSKITIDSIAFYNKVLTTSDADRHYVYATSHSVSPLIFSSRGGLLYNLSLKETTPSFNKSYSIRPDFAAMDIDYDNVIHVIDGITMEKLNQPILFVDSASYISSSADQIYFSSSSGLPTSAFIQIENISQTFNNDYLFNDTFVKFNIGSLPEFNDYQTIMTISNGVSNDIIRFDIKNYSTSPSTSSYCFLVTDSVNNQSTSFNLQSTSSSITHILGMFNDDATRFFYTNSASQSITTASFSTASIDPFLTVSGMSETGYFRIGSSNNYSSLDDVTIVDNIKQFYGVFKGFSISKPLSLSDILSRSYTDFNSPNTSSSMSVYYHLTRNSSLDKFTIYSEGTATFDLPLNNFISNIFEDSIFISANRLFIGYPDASDALEKELSVYVTGYEYGSDIDDSSTDTVFQSKTALTKVNHLNWLNNVDLSNKYLKFEISFNANDITKNIPKINQISVHAYPITTNGSSSYFELNSDIKIFSASNNYIGIPEFSMTPTIFLKDYSGVNIKNNYANIQFSSNVSYFDPTTTSSLVVWLDARFTNGLRANRLSDNQSVSIWKNVSANSNNATQANSSKQPVYRKQAINLLSVNQSNGGESGSVTVFTSVNSDVNSAIKGVITGTRSIRITPNSGSTDSYIQTSASNVITPYLFAGETYTAIGTVSIIRQHSASSINTGRISAVTSSGGGAIEFKSASITNASGQYNASVTFTIPSNATYASIRYYNGSSASTDLVFWDNLGIYSGSTIYGAPVSWYKPLQLDIDNEVIKFDGSDDYLNILTGSIAQPITCYIVARSFKDNGGIFGGIVNNPSIYTASGKLYAYAGTSASLTVNNKNFNIFTVIYNSTSSSARVNGSAVFSGNLGSGGFGTYGVNVGAGYVGTLGASATLGGDIYALLIYRGAHNTSTIESTESWLRDVWEE